MSETTQDALPEATQESASADLSATVETPADKTPVNGGTPPDNKHGDNNGDTPAWLPARLERARENAVKELLGSLGVEDTAQVKAALAEHKALKEAQMTEQEKRAAELETLQSELASAQQAKAEIEQSFEAYKALQLEQTLTERRKSAMQTALQNTLNAKAVLLLIQDEFAEDYQAILDDEGAVNDTAVKTLIEKASATYGELFRVSTNPGSPSSTNRGYSAQPVAMTEQEREKRMRSVFR